MNTFSISMATGRKTETGFQFWGTEPNRNTTEAEEKYAAGHFSCSISLSLVLSLSIWVDCKWITLQKKRKKIAAKKTKWNWENDSCVRARVRILCETSWCDRQTTLIMMMTGRKYFASSVIPFSLFCYFGIPACKIAQKAKSSAAAPASAAAVLYALRMRRSRWRRRHSINCFNVEVKPQDNSSFIVGTWTNACECVPVLCS